MGVIFSRRTCPLGLTDQLLYYGVGPAAFVLCVIAGLAYFYSNVWRHSRWCPAREKPILRLSQSILSEASGGELLRRRLQRLPEGCTVRNASSLQLQPACTEVVVVSQRGAACGCPRLLHLAWLRCCTASDPRFATFVANSLALRACGAHTVLVLTHRLYVLHLRDPQVLLRLLPEIAAGRCACRARLDGEVVQQPDLAAISRMAARRKVVVAEAGNVTLRSLQRFFLSLGSRSMEIDFEQFQEDARLADQLILGGEEDPLIDFV